MRSDKELIDALEDLIKRKPLVLWDGVGEFPGKPGPAVGISTLQGARSLRRALSDCLDYPEQRKAAK